MSARNNAPRRDAGGLRASEFVVGNGSSIARRIRDELAECNTGYVLKPRDVSATLPGRDEDAPLRDVFSRSGPGGVKQGLYPGTAGKVEQWPTKKDKERKSGVKRERKKERKKKRERGKKIFYIEGSKRACLEAPTRLLAGRASISVHQP